MDNLAQLAVVLIKMAKDSTGKKVAKGAGTAGAALGGAVGGAYVGFHAAQHANTEPYIHQSHGGLERRIKGTAYANKAQHHALNEAHTLKLNRGSRRGAIVGATLAGVATHKFLHREKKASTNVYLEKISGIPAAILGGLTGAIAPVGMVYGATLGLHRGEREKLLALLTKEQRAKLEKKSQELIEKLAGIGDVGKALIKSKIGPSLAQSGRSVERVARGVLGHKVNAAPLGNKVEAARQALHGSVVKAAPNLKYTADQSAKIMAVAGRAKRMGVV